MKNCNNCGNAVNEDVKFCTSCGNRIDIDISNKKSENPLDDFIFKDFNINDNRENNNFHEYENKNKYIINEEKGDEITESPLMGYLSIIFGFMGLMGLFFGIIGLIINKNPVNRKRHKIGIGLSIFWLVITIIIVITKRF